MVSLVKKVLPVGNVYLARAALFAYSDPAEALQIYKTFEKYGNVT